MMAKLHKNLEVKVASLNKFEQNLPQVQIIDSNLKYHIWTTELT